MVSIKNKEYERLLELAKKYETYSTPQKKYREKHKEYYKEYHKKWQKDNKEKISQYQKEWRAKKKQIDNKNNNSIIQETGTK